jgi:N-methylhydantoinase A
MTPNEPATGGLSIAVDTGGTFTDVVVADAAGNLHIDKAPTRPDDPVGAVREALDVIAPRLGRAGADDLLAEAHLFLYATTRATNAVLERKTPPIALLVTEGFPAILTLREGGKENPYDFSVTFPEPLVAPELTFEIPERVDAEGGVVRPLDLDAAAAAIEQALARGAEAIGVCFLWSVLRPDHEERIGALLDERFPGVPYTLSHRVNPVPREYRRAVATVIDGALKPLMQHHLNGVGEGLTAAGFAGTLLVVSSTGGALPLAAAVAKPIHTVASGPSMAPIAARWHAVREGIDNDLVVCDTGGTSFDVSLVRDGRIPMTREARLGSGPPADLIGVPTVSVRSFGAGGGSIAWIDDGGLLRLGPASAGAEPGPACYGRGGDRPTITDAALLLGYLDPDRFLDGRFPLDRAAAEVAVRTHVADPLGIGVLEACAGIWRVAVEIMAAGVREATLDSGLDARTCAIVSGGGAGGLLAADLARTLGIPTLLVPRTAAALSAVGAHHGDVVNEAAISVPLDTEDFAPDGLRRALAALSADATAFLDALPEALRSDSVEHDFSVEARYRDQVWDVELSFDPAQVLAGDPGAIMRELFHARHLELFAVNDPASHVECLTWRQRTTIRGQATDGSVAPPGGDGRATGEGAAYFGGAMVPTARVDGRLLKPDGVLAGPAVVDDGITTLVVPPGHELRVTAHGDYLINTSGEETA